MNIMNIQYFWSLISDIIIKHIIIVHARVSRQQGDIWNRNGYILAGKLLRMRREGLKPQRQVQCVNVLLGNSFSSTNS